MPKYNIDATIQIEADDKESADFLLEEAKRNPNGWECSIVSGLLKSAQITED